jgi:hypothetical protein
MMTRALPIALIAASLCVVASARADEGRWSFSSGAEYTSGDYGEAQDTTIIIAPFTFGYKTDRWGARITVPWVSIEGPGTIVPGSSGSAAGGAGGLSGLLGATTDLVGGLLDGLLGGDGPPGGADAPAPSAIPTNVNEDGLGDITVAVSGVPFRTDAGTRLTLGARVRIPTADADRSLGIDDTALAVSSTLAHSFGGDAAIYGSIGLEHAFESDANAFFAQVGAETYIVPRLLLGASADWAQANAELRRDSTQATAYAGYDATSEIRFLLYGTAGLTETSPDFGAGLRLIYTPE